MKNHDLLHRMGSRAYNNRHADKYSGLSCAHASAHTHTHTQCKSTKKMNASRRLNDLTLNPNDLHKCKREITVQIIASIKLHHRFIRSYVVNSYFVQEFYMSGYLTLNFVATHTHNHN